MYKNVGIVIKCECLWTVSWFYVNRCIILLYLFMSIVVLFLGTTDEIYSSAKSGVFAVSTHVLSVYALSRLNKLTTQICRVYLQ